MKILLALLLTTSAASAQSLCTPMEHEKIVVALEKNAGETNKFVGSLWGKIPMEVYTSDSGTWTILILTPEGVCFVGAGDSWQSVEPKPAGVEN